VGLRNKIDKSGFFSLAGSFENIENGKGKGVEAFHPKWGRLNEKPCRSIRTDRSTGW
jgi:hypothetical protein